MKSSPTAHQTRRSQRGFTLVELAATGSLMGIMGMILFGVLRSGTVLSSQNTGINVSASRARMALDQIGDRVRYSMAPPVLINTSGAEVGGTTADGIMLKKLVGSPYVVKKSDATEADIASNTTLFCVEYQQELAKPLVGDWMLVESIERPELQITNVTEPEKFSSPGSATQNMRRVKVTTATALGEVARPAFYRVSAFLFRKQAFVFAPADGAGSRFELRHYNPVTASTNFSTASNYRVEADSYRRLSAQAFFTDLDSNGAKTTMLRAMVSSSSKTEYIARKSNTNTYTAVPIQLRLWSINK